MLKKRDAVGNMGLSGYIKIVPNKPTAITLTPSGKRLKSSSKSSATQKTQKKS